MPLAPRYDWVDVIIGFDSFDAAAAYALALGGAGRHPEEARDRRRGAGAARLFPAPSRPDPSGQERRPGDDRAACARRLRGVHPACHRGAEILFNSSRAAPETLRGLPPIYELAWNHTTLRALRVDPAITYLQVRYPEDGALALIKRIHDRFGAEVIGHLELIRFNGRIGFAGLPMVRFSTEERLEEIMAEHEAMGAMIFNPHRYTLEEGGMKQTDATQLAFKRETDPDGLLNPGKMIAWEDPNFDFSAGKNFLFPGLEARALAAQI